MKMKESGPRGGVHPSFHLDPPMSMMPNLFDPCTFTHASQWWIQDFPEEGAPTPQVGRQHTILPYFPKNCMKLKKFGPPGGARPWRPLRSATASIGGTPVWNVWISVCRCATECVMLFEFFTVNTKLPEMVMLASKDFTAAKKVTPPGFNLMITGSKV